MSGPTDVAPEALAIWRRRLGFRSWHRGTREADLLLGSFADRHLDGFGAVELARYEALLEVADPELYDWVTGRAAVPAEFDHHVTRLLRAHRYATNG